MTRSVGINYDLLLRNINFRLILIVVGIIIVHHSAVIKRNFLSAFNEPHSRSYAINVD